MAYHRQYEYFCTILYDKAWMSSSQQEIQFCQDFHQRLKEWFGRHLPVKTEWESAYPRHHVIADAMRNTKYFIVLYTETFLKGPWFQHCEKYIHKADQGNLTCTYVPVGINGFSRFYFCKDKQPVVFTDLHDDATWEKMMRDLSFDPDIDTFTSKTTVPDRVSGGEDRSVWHTVLQENWKKITESISDPHKIVDHMISKNMMDSEVHDKIDKEVTRTAKARFLLMEIEKKPQKYIECFVEGLEKGHQYLKEELEKQAQAVMFKQSVIHHQSPPQQPIMVSSEKTRKVEGQALPHQVQISREVEDIEEGMEEIHITQPENSDEEDTVDAIPGAQTQESLGPETRAKQPVPSQMATASIPGNGNREMKVTELTRETIVEDLLYIVEETPGVCLSDLHFKYKGDSQTRSCQYVLTDFWQTWLETYCEGNHEKVPCKSPDFCEHRYQYLGEILRQGYMKYKYFPQNLCVSSLIYAIHGAVDDDTRTESFYNYIDENEKVTIERVLKNDKMDEKDKSQLYETFSRFGIRKAISLAKLPTCIKNCATSELLHTPATFLKFMGLESWKAYDDFKTPEAIHAFLQSLHASPERVLDCLNAPENISKPEERALSFLKRAIKNMNQSTLCSFLFHVTGSDILKNETKLTVQFQKPTVDVFRFQSCASEVSVPICFEHFQSFDRQLTKTLYLDEDFVTAALAQTQDI